MPIPVDGSGTVSGCGEVPLGEEARAALLVEGGAAFEQAELVSRDPEHPTRPGAALLFIKKGER
jgi:hypothetical protein